MAIRSNPFLACALVLTACSTQATPPPAVDRVQECKLVKAAISEELARLSACTSDAECGKTVSFPGSCGCTQGPVVRLDADDAKYNALLVRFHALHDVPGCASTYGTCVCPEKDGVICNGHCGWKELDRSTLCERLVDRYVGTRKRECAANGREDCTATLTLKNGTVELVRESPMRRGTFQCNDGVLHLAGGLTDRANISPDGSISLLDDVYQPAPGAVAERATAPAEDPIGLQSKFMDPSGEINCIYTGRGGTGIYTPADGGPEIACERSSGRSFERAHLGREGPARIESKARYVTCCSVEPVLPEGAHLVRGPFRCDSTAGEIICKRDDGPGFAIGKRIRALRN